MSELMPLPPPPLPEGCVCDGRAFGCWDWSKGALALVASDGEKAVILQHTGGALDYWLSEVGDSETFDGLEPGLWIWEGNLNSWRDYWGDYDEELDGDFRKLTEEEWEIVRDGENLWDDNDRLKCSEEIESPSDSPAVQALRDAVDELGKLATEVQVLDGRAIERKNSEAECSECEGTGTIYDYGGPFDCALCDEDSD